MAIILVPLTFISWCGFALETLGRGRPVSAGTFFLRIPLTILIMIHDWLIDWLIKQYCQSLIFLFPASQQLHLQNHSEDKN